MPGYLPTALTFSHEPFLAEVRTASQMYCVSSASRKVGPAGYPVERLARKSAT